MYSEKETNKQYCPGDKKKVYHGGGEANDS